MHSTMYLQRVQIDTNVSLKSVPLILLWPKFRIVFVLVVLVLTCCLHNLDAS